MIRSRHGSKLLRRLMIGGVALVVPILAGCEAGNNSPELEFHPAAGGAYGSADAVTVSDAFILGGQGSTPLAKGGSAGMFLSVYNGGDSADKLISVDATSVAKSVQLTGGSIAVAGQSSADLSGPEPKIVLRNLSKALVSGQTVTVLLTFSNAGSVELNVPIEDRSTYYSTFSPPAPVPSATKRVSVGATSPAGTATPSTSASASGSASTSATPIPSTTP
ncbi:MAG TPA: copper chaperone PCu(A)C [Streptosporangiaceae bacterium]